MKKIRLRCENRNINMTNYLEFENNSILAVAEFFTIFLITVKLIIIRLI